MTEKKTELIPKPAPARTQPSKSEGKELDAIRALAANVREHLPDEKLVNKAIQEIGGEVGKAGRLIVGALADDKKGQSLLDKLFGE